MVVTEDIARGVFHPIVAKDTAVPCRRAATIAAPKGGGDVLIKVCEGIRDIKVSQPPKANGTTKNTKSTNNSNSDDSDNDDDDSDAEPDEVREKIWKVTSVLAEAAVRAVKKGGKVEVTVNVTKDMSVQITAREVGAKGGVRGDLGKVNGVENGSA